MSPLAWRTRGAGGGRRRASDRDANRCSTCDVRRLTHAFLRWLQSNRWRSRGGRAKRLGRCNQVAGQSTPTQSPRHDRCGGGHWQTVRRLSRVTCGSSRGGSPSLRPPSYAGSVFVVGGSVNCAMREVLPFSVALCEHSLVPDGELPTSRRGVLEAANVAPVRDYDISMHFGLD